jgi:SAM-dependent methyltransferase
MYTPDRLEYWIETSRNQSCKDEIFMRNIQKYFSPGNVLEIGAGVGQLSLILKARGFDVTSSDIEDFFVAHMRSKGLKAVKLDATNIMKGTNLLFDNIIAQGVSPFVSKDLSVVRSSYESVYESLNACGRFIFFAPITKETDRFSNITEHQEIISETNFKVIKVFRNQVLPSRWYRYVPSFLVDVLESSFGKKYGIRSVIILEK